MFVVRSKSVLTGLSALALCLSAGRIAEARTVTAAGCSVTEVQAAINGATTGDTVVIPDGSCAWSRGVQLGGRGLHITGASKWGTSITHNAGAASLFALAEHASLSTRLSNIRFVQGSGGAEAWQGMFIRVDAVPAGRPVLIDNNAFKQTKGGQRAIRVAVNRGVIWQNEFDAAGVDAQAIAFTALQDDVPPSWSSPDTIGARDAAGNRNVYLEDNTFRRFPNQCLDVDENSRVVIRHNLFDHAAIASHGADTGVKGTRHWELYDNEFVFTSFGDCDGSKTMPVSRYFYVRGGTGVIADNIVRDLSSCAWGTPVEFNLQQQALRRNAGEYACYSGAYPMPYQIGWDFDGKDWKVSPIYVWGNTGTGANAEMLGTSDYNPNECGPGAKRTSDYVQPGREYLYGVAKPGYTKYVYPHPLRGGGSPPPAPQSPKPPLAPSNLKVN